MPISLIKALVGAGAKKLEQNAANKHEVGMHNLDKTQSGIQDFGDQMSGMMPQQPQANLSLMNMLQKKPPMGGMMPPPQY